MVKPETKYEADREKNLVCLILFVSGVPCRKSVVLSERLSVSVRTEQGYLDVDVDPGVNDHIKVGSPEATSPESF